MRNRNGNRTYTCTICAIIFFSTLSLYADEYLISYRYVVKNAILFNDSLEVSRAMRKCSGEPSNNSITLFGEKANSLKNIISTNSDEFLSFIHKLNLDVQHSEININYQNSSTTIITLRTQCFKVDFNENFAIITPLK